MSKYSVNNSRKQPAQKVLSIFEEVNEFEARIMECKTTLKTFWSDKNNKIKLPRLYCEAIKCYTDCSSSSPSESIFSKSGFKGRKARSRLDAKTLEMEMMCAQESEIDSILSLYR